MINLLYFAWVRERVGVANEEVAMPSDVNTVAELIGWQCQRGDGYAEAFADDKLVRVAVNQEHVELGHPIQNGDEVAFFPPVTGG